MALIETRFAPLSFARALGGIADRLIAVLTAAYGTDRRYDEVLRLQAKTDEELAALGLKREDIAAHVYRDLIHV